jgi:riboflavin synthase
MFTGIVQGKFPLLMVEARPGLNRLVIELSDELLIDLAIGASVAIDGVCLTVTAIEPPRVYFDVMQQTLSLTTLAGLAAGDWVNVERSAKQGVEIGGHIISGHVDGTVEVVSVEQPENNCFIRYRVPADKMKYLFSKGFIGLNGCSLTVADVDPLQQTVQVCFIPETLRVTTHGNKRPGDRLNFEVDRQTQTIVDTVENFLTANPQLVRPQ